MPVLISPPVLRWQFLWSQKCDINYWILAITISEQLNLLEKHFYFNLISIFYIHSIIGGKKLYKKIFIWHKFICCKYVYFHTYIHTNMCINISKYVCNENKEKIKLILAANWRVAFA